MQWWYSETLWEKYHDCRFKFESSGEDKYNRPVPRIIVSMSKKWSRKFGKRNSTSVPRRGLTIWTLDVILNEDNLLKEVLIMNDDLLNVGLDKLSDLLTRLELEQSLILFQKVIQLILRMRNHISKALYGPYIPLFLPLSQMILLRLGFEQVTHELCTNFHGTLIFFTLTTSSLHTERQSAVVQWDYFLD